MAPLLSTLAATVTHQLPTASLSHIRAYLVSMGITGKETATAENEKTGL